MQQEITHKYTINFVGNFQTGYVGEVADETHLARKIKSLGNTVRRIPRDEWREYVREGCPKGRYPNVPLDLKADINIFAKWNHFDDGTYIAKLKELSQAPAFYWVWDFMEDNGIPEWHLQTARLADLYLSGEGGIKNKYKALGIKHYYFQFDVCDGDIPRKHTFPRVFENDVIFTGSYLGQGHRVQYLQEITERIPVKIFAWNYQDWIDNGFEAFPAKYGEAYNQLIAESKIVLGMSVEPNCWGYWSNRVGKVIRAGGFLLQEYAPGMEQFLEDKAVYFNSPKEAIEKIKFYLEDEEQRKKVTFKAMEDEEKFTSKRRIMQLMILIDRYLKGSPEKWLL